MLLLLLLLLLRHRLCRWHPQGFTQGMLETYDLYRLDALGSLKTWDLFQRPESLAVLALDIKRLRR